MAGKALPDDTSTFKVLHYIRGQATLGRFDGHSTALLVMYYLAMNMWVRPSPDGLQGRGEVMFSQSGLDDIAAGTALSRSSVQRALRWLGEEEWVDTERSADSTGRETSRYIYLRLDSPGCRERERRRAVTEAAERILTEASRP